MTKLAYLAAASVALLAGCAGNGLSQQDYNAMSCAQLAYEQGKSDAEIDAARDKSFGGSITSALAGDDFDGYGETEMVIGGIEEDRAAGKLEMIRIAQSLKRC
ncbi:hypothetical protein [Paracoccus sp. SCSIO 75233]|uniref:hypothetical protein n=1 Tax=Paracoccus sp. SCSIO 75233 TaxID=3017782 RepID=UPI0022F0BAF6|nr:hypothetical protein [Paracoccus sp. SCSIO 75233]WBU52272.1 hypothetical protein PAF12_10550 [Paracoccus sp. SCSIO 75233]